MPKIAYVDIGELGWSLYLSAHLRWLKENTDYSLAIIVSSDRKCLYGDSADLVLDVPYDFYEKFKGEQNCFGLYPPIRKKAREYFQKILPSDYVIPENFNFSCNRNFLMNKVIYKPYGYAKKLKGKEKILIFPRQREHPAFSYRNLSRSFYIELIEILCNEFPDYEVKTIGLNSGSYNIGEIKKNNYINGVKEGLDLQNMIDECQLAIAAIGGTSSLPKISLLQKVPTFIMGHEKKRFIEHENWLKTKTEFYKIGRYSYAKLNSKECINRIILFIKEEDNGKDSN